MKVRVGLCQIRPRTGDIEANLKTIREMAARASRKEVDILLFPELALTGYMARDELFELAQPVNGEAVSELEAIAREHGVYLVVGMPELDEHTFMLYNSAVVVGPEGLVGTYRKRHLPSYGVFDEARYFKPFKGPIEVFDLSIGKVGVAICYDLFFPETVRTMALKGAKLVLVLSAAPDMSKEYFETLVKARAMENTIFVAYVNLVGHYEGLGFFGGSHMRGPLGELVTSLGLHEEGLAVGEADYGYLRSAREARPIIGDINLRDFDELSNAVLQGPLMTHQPGG